MFHWRYCAEPLNHRLPSRKAPPTKYPDLLAHWNFHIRAPARFPVTAVFEKDRSNDQMKYWTSPLPDTSGTGQRGNGASLGLDRRLPLRGRWQYGSRYPLHLRSAALGLDPSRCFVAAESAISCP